MSWAQVVRKSAGVASNATPKVVGSVIKRCTMHDFCLDPAVTSLKDLTAKDLKCRDCGNHPLQREFLLKSPIVDEDAMGNAETRLMACSWNSAVDQLAACLKSGERCDEYSVSGNTAWSYVNVRSGTSMKNMATIWLLSLFGHDYHMRAAEGGLPIYERSMLYSDWELYQFCIDMGWTEASTREQIIKESWANSYAQVFHHSDRVEIDIEDVERRLDEMRQTHGIGSHERIRLGYYTPEKTCPLEEIEVWRLKLLHVAVVSHELNMAGYATLCSEIIREGPFSSYTCAMRNCETIILDLLKKPLDKVVLNRQISVRRYNGLL